MADTDTTRIFCILPRLGAGVGGGKVNAMFRRMNLLADRDGTLVTLLNLKHDCNQKIAFAELVKAGLLDRRIVHQSLFEFCVPPGPVPQDAMPSLPDWDDRKTAQGTRERIIYLRNGTPVMRDTVSQSAAGDLTIRRILTDPGRDIRLKYLDGALVESRAEPGDGRVEKTSYADGLPRCRSRRETGALVDIRDFGLGQSFTNEIAHQRTLVAQHAPEGGVFFIDGVTSAYLSRLLPGQKVLFLHADHRDASGTVVPRSRGLIEAFDGDAIVTATEVHKRQLEKDTVHKAPIRVIPHYTDATPDKGGPRAHICTVSRLDLGGKPIHHCIEAFTRIMHLIPDCNYLIYGTGLGEARLQQLIDHAGCGDRVVLMGRTTEPEAVFRQSLMSLAPTLTEGFGLSLLESLSCNCPVISYDVDYGPRELITPGCNGELVQPGDIEALAKAILHVHAHQADYAAACPASVQAYSFEAYTARYHALIDEVLAKRFHFDISARDLGFEAWRALEKSPDRHRDRLLDLYIHLCHLRRDVAGMYQGFHEKQLMHPKDQRPLIRCIWLSRRLGKQDACRAYLDLFAKRFPTQHRQFVKRFPDFLDLATIDGAADWDAP